VESVGNRDPTTAAARREGPTVREQRLPEMFHVKQRGSIPTGSMCLRRAYTAILQGT
jgi:hypothetical protein